MPARGVVADPMLDRMIECSELRIGAAAAHEPGHAGLAASRVMESAHAWRDWGNSHVRLLGTVTTHRRAGPQVQAVWRMALSTIHRKAPFEYLRDVQIRGSLRRRFFLEMFGGSDYAHTMVREHRSYISAMCSYLCVEHFCGPDSLQRIRAYERAYTSYWQALAGLQLEAAGGVAAGYDAALVHYLRRELQRARTQVLDSGPSAADQLTLEQLRRPNGDTVRLPPGPWSGASG